MRIGASVSRDAARSSAIDDATPADSSSDVPPPGTDVCSGDRVSADETRAARQEEVRANDKPLEEDFVGNLIAGGLFSGGFGGVAGGLAGAAKEVAIHVVTDAVMSLVHHEASSSSDAPDAGRATAPHVRISG